MAFLGYVLFVAAIVAVDQISKYCVVKSLPLLSQAELLPGVLGLTHIRNQGAAFSSFQGLHWLFALIFLVFTGLVLWEYFRKPLKFSAFERWCIAAIYGGGLGNMIDRLRQGYVVDMFETQFVDFPIFNVADCFITCGCIFLIIHTLFFNKPFWKEENK